MRVLDWMLKRIVGEVDAVETAIGYVPKAEDINIDGAPSFLLDIQAELWKDDVRQRLLR